jgi:tyrosinase
MSLRLRKDAHELDEEDRLKYATAFLRLKQVSDAVPSDNNGFFELAGYHGWPHYWCWHHLTRSRPGIVSRPLRLFFPWHRAYLHRLEQLLLDHMDDVAIPWWDWSSDISRKIGMPKLFTDLKIGGQPNPLVSINLPNNIPKDRLPEGTPDPPVTWRAPRPLRELPTPEEVGFALTKNDFEDAELYIEDLHDRIHGWVSGTMGEVATAAYDMIFYSHHCMIDRIWYLWQKRYGNASGLEDILDEPLDPFGLTVNKVLDIHQLGYDYAFASLTIEI